MEGGGTGTLRLTLRRGDGETGKRGSLPRSPLSFPHPRPLSQVGRGGRRREEFGDLLDTVPIGVEDVDLGARFDSGDQALIVFNCGVDYQELIGLLTKVGKTRVIWGEILGIGIGHS